MCHKIFKKHNTNIRTNVLKKVYYKTVKTARNEEDKHLDTPTLENLYNYAEQAHITIIETPLNTAHTGYYDHATHNILLDSTLNDRQKRCTLAHELIHAKYEHTGHDLKNERKTRKETALWLINIFDYIQAERIYEGNNILIGLELNVTQQVLGDYQNILAQYIQSVIASKTNTTNT